MMNAGPRSLTSVALAVAAAVTVWAGEHTPPFRRIAFEEKVPLGEEAPFFATDGHLVAFGSGPKVRVVDVRTGETVHKRSLELGDGRRPGRYKVRVLGIVNRVVYACVRHFAGPPA